VYIPLLVTEPPDDVHVTAVLLVPLTLAVNCFCWPTCKEALSGDKLTDTLPDVLPEPNTDTWHDDELEPDDQAAGNVVRLVCILLTE